MAASQSCDTTSRPGAGTDRRRGNISTIAQFERALWTLVALFSHRSVTAEVTRGTDHALPPASWALLHHLYNGGPMRVSDIAAWHGVEVSSVTPRLQALEAEGLIERSRDARDRRVSVIAIGARGREALRRIHAARADLIAGALAPEDLAMLPQLTPVLERISQSLEIAAVPPPAVRRG